MKKNYVLLLTLLISTILFLSSFLINFVKAKENLPDLPISTKQMEHIENFPNLAQTKWDYLQKEWKNILTKNKFVNATDNFMQKSVPNTSFRIIFGINWNVEYLPTMIGIIILWLFVFVAIANLLKTIPISSKNSEFEGFLCYIISFLLMILFAQLNIFYNFVVWLGKLIFKQENIWIRFLYFMIAIVIFIFIISISNMLEKSSKIRKEKNKEEEKEQKIEKMESFVEGIKKGKKISSS